VSDDPQGEQTIRFSAIVSQVRTLADEGLRVTLDLPEDAVYQAAWLMEVKRAEAVVAVSCQIEPGNVAKHR
jgi:hypothetical protein